MNRANATSVAVASALVLVLTSCAQAPVPAGSGASNSSASASSSKVCLVAGKPGLGDGGQNQAANAALEALKADLGVQIRAVEVTDPATYAQELQRQSTEGCQIVVSVGAELRTELASAAKANPNVSYVLLDESVTATGLPANFTPVFFNTHEAAFLAGYAAAAQSKTGKVAALGSLDATFLTQYLDGFEQGIAYYNQSKSKKIELLGWSRASNQGELLAAGADAAAVKAKTAELMGKGADVVMPVAGGASSGALEAAAPGKLAVVWTGTDGCVTQTPSCPVILTSVAKNYQGALTEVVKQTTAGSSPAKPYYGGLANEGSDITGFNSFDAQVSAETKAELEQIKQRIISGEITVKNDTVVG